MPNRANIMMAMVARTSQGRHQPIKNLVLLANQALPSLAITKKEVLKLNPMGSTLPALDMGKPRA
jgi:hypothetical protein